MLIHRDLEKLVRAAIERAQRQGICLHLKYLKFRLNGRATRLTATLPRPSPCSWPESREWPH